MGYLTEWAEKSEAAAVAKARADDPKLRSYRKKAPDLALHLRGVSVLEQRLRQGRRGGQVRPFCKQAQNKRPSLFAADATGTDGFWSRPFVCEKRAKKMREHYGVELPASSVRECTLAHAKASGGRGTPGSETARADAWSRRWTGRCCRSSATKTGPGLDGRKGKELSWREARLVFGPSAWMRWTGFTGRPSGRCRLRVCSGAKWLEAAGLGPQTRVHGLGDGATWIVHTSSKSNSARAQTHGRLTPSIFIMSAITWPRPLRS